MADKLNRFADIRGISEIKKYTSDEYLKEDIITYTFNENTILLNCEETQSTVLKNGCNPGLGIRELHKQGITGKNVNAAIIDQNLLLNHPEFKGKIIEYYDTGCNQHFTNGSMHAPAVTSLFVGENIGTAPDTKLYFAAVPSWKGDSEYFANALLWIIGINKRLRETEKIKVVSVSASPSGYHFYKNQNKWIEAVEIAHLEGILILDCRQDQKTGFIGPAYYDINYPDDLTKCKTGFANNSRILQKNMIGVPSSRRTVAEEYNEGNPSFTYWGEGGLSWAIPYAAGVLCLGWQINPILTQTEIVKILFDSCYIDINNSKIINPIDFINAVKKTIN